MAEIIEMPIQTECNNINVAQEETLVTTLIHIAEDGDKGAILDYLEELSEIYRNKKELGAKELTEVMDVYAYFRSNLESVTFLERIDRWGQESCYFLDFGAKIMSQTYEQIALKIQKTLRQDQQDLIASAVRKIGTYVNQGSEITISFLNECIPSFQIIVNKENDNEEMAGQIETAFSYQYVTSGIIKGVLKNANGCQIFGFYFDENGMHSMTEDEILFEFYTSEDGIKFHLEENTTVIDLLEEGEDAE